MGAVSTGMKVASAGGAKAVFLERVERESGLAIVASPNSVCRHLVALPEG